MTSNYLKPGDHRVTSVRKNYNYDFTDLWAKYEKETGTSENELKRTAEGKALRKKLMDKWRAKLRNEREKKLSEMHNTHLYMEENSPVKSRKNKSRKDPNAPKRAAPSYIRWLNDHRDQIRDEHCAHLEGRDRTTGISKKAGELWKAMSDEDKAPYVKRYAEAKAKYDEEMAVYVTDSVKSSGPKYDATDYPEAPEGWSGPYLHAYLKKNVKDDDANNLKFKTFEEAVAHANTLDIEVCAGITKTNHFYELRVGPNIIAQTIVKQSGLGVWVRGEPVFNGDAFDVNVDHLARAETEQLRVSTPDPALPEPEENVSAQSEPEPELLRYASKNSSRLTEVIADNVENPSKVAQYLKILEELGIDNCESLSYWTEEELVKEGFLKGHARMICRKLA